MQAPVSLLCLPCAGASATMYLRWRRLLPRWIELVPVELPGRGSRMGERFAEDFDELVALLCEEQSQALRGCYVLFGHSMGALLAWGMAARLRDLGRPLPRALFASGSPAPSRRDPDRFANKDSDAALIADLRKQGGTPEEVFASAELMRITLDVLGADYRVCASFRHRGGGALPFPVHALGGLQDDIAAERIEAWSAEAHADFSLDWFEGGHFFIRQQESQVLLALRRRLARTLVGGVMRLSPLPDALAPGIEAYRLDLDLDSDPMHAWPVLTPDERAHAARFAQRADRVRFAATRAAARRLLASRLDCCPAEVPLGRSAHGKPFVDGDAQDLPLFNVTHSGAYAVIAIADAACVGDVGVDIERCDAGMDTQPMLEAVFTQEECDAVRAAADPLAAFYLRWVGKEAVLKAIGVGLAQDLRSIRIRPAGDRVLAVGCEGAARISVQAVALAAPQGYAAALAWRNKEPQT